MWTCECNIIAWRLVFVESAAANDYFVSSSARVADDFPRKLFSVLNQAVKL